MPDETTTGDALARPAASNPTAADGAGAGMTPAPRLPVQPAPRVPTPPLAAQAAAQTAGDARPTAAQAGATPVAAQGTAATPANEASVLGKLEPLFKLAAAGVGLVAALGFPAVYLNLRRFGVPSHFISYDQVLRAGALPTAALVLVGIYLYAAAREYQSKERRLWFLFVPGALLVSLPLAAYLVLFAGTVVFIFTCGWALSQPFVWLLWKAFGIVVPDKPLLIIPGALLTMIAERAWPRLKHTRVGAWAHSLGERAPDWIDNLFAALPNSFSRQFAVYLFFAVFCVLLLFDIRWFLSHWRPGWSPAYLRSPYLLLWGAAGGLLLGFFVLLVTLYEWFRGEDASKRRRAFTSFVSAVVLGLLAAIAIYSDSIYPTLPQGLGGGKPARVVVWFGKDDFPADLQRRLAPARFTSDDKTTRGDDLYLLYESSDTLIFANGEAPPAAGVRIARDKVEAISW
ncbi:MAG: hypothetical protein LC746_09190 [Acidobacteria bacterium]|nr:hypothetical protein [Acidobacteriota bacterium]